MRESATNRWLLPAGAIAACGVALAILATTVGVEDHAAAQDRNGEALENAKPAHLDKYAYLKRLSLDLRGVPPTIEEYEALDGVDDVPEATIDALLYDEGFLSVMTDYHRDLLWGNVSNFQYIQFPWDLSRTTVGPSDDSHAVLYLYRKGAYFRGAPGTQENVRVPCSHLPAEFDESGYPTVVEVTPEGHRLEGWVWVEPYWAPDDPVKVCAYDAIEADVSPGGVDCGTVASRQNTSCGCGEGLRFCDFRGDGVNVQVDVGLALSEQMLQIVRWVIETDQPYHEILTTRRSFVNGPIVHYYKHQLKLASLIDLEPAPIETVFLPDMRWDDWSWQPVLRGDEHSGILTSYGFLLRFQTNRSRVNRFYNAFLDNFFDASKSTGTSDCSDEGADLTKRCYCQNCHLAVEPWAAYWARWKQQGAGYLDTEEFPIFDEVCASCARTGVGSCPTYCRNEYVIETVPADREPYVGYLRGFEFLKDQHMLNTDAGPRLWVERSIQDGSLARGVVSKMWQHFMRREFTGSGADDALREELFAHFVGENYNVRALIKAIVQQDSYRRIR